MSAVPVRKPSRSETAASCALTLAASPAASNVTFGVVTASLPAAV
jgi:hypothetical protein